jgi:ABC-type transport system involved in multi-copper enzyme maturation permease subunit
MILELARQEAIKLFSQRFAWALPVLVLALQAASMIVTALRPPETSLDALSGPQLWADGVGLGLRMSVFLLLVVGAMSFSREFSLGTAKTMLVLPIPRRHWLAGKLVALLALAAALLLAVALLAAVIVAATVGWGPVAREGVVLYTTGQALAHAAAAVAVTLPLLAPLCACALLVGLHFSSSGAAVGVAVLLGLVLETAVNLLDSGARFVFFQHLPRAILLVGRLGRGLAFQWEPILTWGLGVAAVSFAVFVAWLAWRLERMDIAQ